MQMKLELSGTKAQKSLEYPSENTLTSRPLLKQRMRNYAR